ncbi:amino acid ABC transporter permease [Devosia honganensis]|uniref:Amino acid ABC transporter permease n=1 Tax=Devosia honganensis TaxID=1610527 RepID=A0ABV7X2H9_9HYPH
MIEIIQTYWLDLLIGSYPNGPLGGLAMTMIIAVVSIALAVPLGVLLALAELSSRRWLSLATGALITFVRGVPLLMFIFWIYFVVPVITGISIQGTTTLIIALVIFESAYISQIVKAGILALPKGQSEAAESLGMAPWQINVKIILPQAIFNMTPSLISQLSSAVKDTSLGYIINATEVTFATAQINSILLTKPMEVFGILAIIFFVVCTSLTGLASLLEKRLGHAQNAPGVRAS